MKMCIAHRLLLSTSEISDATASMPSPGYFALQHRVAPPRKAYSLTSSAFIAFGALYPFSLFKPVFRGSRDLFCAFADTYYSTVKKKNCAHKGAVSFLFPAQSTNSTVNLGFSASVSVSTLRSAAASFAPTASSSLELFSIFTWASNLFISQR